MESKKVYTGYIKKKSHRHFNIMFRSKKDQKDFGKGLIQAFTTNFKVEGQKITNFKQGNTVTFEVAEDSAYLNGFKAINLMFPKKKPVKKTAQKPVKKTAKKTAKKPVKMTREEWEKDTRPTLLDKKIDWELVFDDDDDWMSKYKLPWFLYDF